MSQAKSAEKVVQEIRGKTRRRFSAEEKIRIVLEGLRGEESIATLCRREGLNPNLYYRWSKEFGSGPRNLDSGFSDISIVFQAAVPKPVVPKYTTSGVRWRPPTR